MIMRYVRKKNRRRDGHQGAAALVSISALALFLLFISIGVGTISFSENAVSGGVSDSKRALIYAEAGAREALIRIARNKAYSCATPALPTGCVVLEMQSGGCTDNTACVRVIVDTDPGSLASPKTVESRGYAGTVSRTIRTEVQYDTSLYGEMATTTWMDVL